MLLGQLKEELEKHSIDLPLEQLWIDDYKKEIAQRIGFKFVTE